MHISVESKLEKLTQVTSFIENNVPFDSMKTSLNIVIDEIFSNIVKFAYPHETGSVDIDLNVDGNTVTLQIADSGIPFNPLVREDPDITLEADKRSIGKLGIFLVKKLMDKVEYTYENNHNILTLTKTNK